MASNTKITSDQKLAVKLFKKTHPHAQFYHIDNMTILLVPRGSYIHVFSAICGGDEQKYRKSVGEFYCLRRYDTNAGFIIPKGSLPLDSIPYRLSQASIW